MISRKDVRDAKTLLGLIRDSIEDTKIEGEAIVGVTIRLNQQMANSMSEAKSFFSAVNTALGQFQGERACELQIHFDMLHPQQAQLEKSIQAKAEAIQKLAQGGGLVAAK